MSKKPRLAVTVSFEDPDPDRHLFRNKTLQYLEEGMVDAWVRAGALPAILCDPRDPDLVRDALAGFDGLVLSGGSDVAPESYGQSPLRDEWRGDRRRDLYEIACVHAALELGLPIFGICRGAQILNVAFGGTLYQDIETQVDDALTHRDQQLYDSLTHEIAVEPGTWIAEQLAQSASKVNSVHHQAIDELGAGLRVAARAPDGTIEAIEAAASDRGLGASIAAVQWHPEWLTEQPDPLLVAFVAHCTERCR